MRSEYDFGGAVRGNYPSRFQEWSNVVVLPPDVAAAFSTPEDGSRDPPSCRHATGPLTATCRSDGEIRTSVLDGSYMINFTDDDLLGLRLAGLPRLRFPQGGPPLRRGSPPCSTLTFQPISSQPRKCGAPLPGVQVGHPQRVMPPSSAR
jgi:hypothetical protein